MRQRCEAPACVARLAIESLRARVAQLEDTVGELQGELDRDLVPRPLCCHSHS